MGVIGQSGLVLNRCFDVSDIKMSNLNAKFDEVNSRFDVSDIKMNEHNTKFDEIRNEINNRILILTSK